MRGESGFTLVELLFAMVAGSLLLVGLGWALHGLERRWQQAMTISDAARVIAVAPFLREFVSHAYPPAKGTAMAGNAETLTLTVPSPLALGTPGPLTLQLDVERRVDSTALVARFAAQDGGRPLPPGASEPRTLAKGFDAIHFEYLRRRGDRADRLPRLITILFTGKDGKILPLAIEPKLTQGADCVFDPISLTCRA